MVSKDRVPDSDNMINREILRKQQHQPPKTVELGIQADLLEMFMQLGINPIHEIVKLTHFAINA